MKFLLYYFLKIYIKIGLFFYAKKTTVLGKENIPKKGAILFVANHPNALIDPLLIATNTKRKIHFLVRAAVFKKPTIAKILNVIGLMPVYRIRDGIKQLSKNDAIFNNCQELLKNQKTLLIFPEGSHNRKRTIRPLSKGFTRILYGAIEKYPDLKIHIVPIGITYQNSSNYPSKVALIFGEPILANNFYAIDNKNTLIKELKTQISDQLKNLTVHINDDENYNTITTALNKTAIDYTDVNKSNELIKKCAYPSKKKIEKENKLLYYSIILNSFIPYLIWKSLSEKIPEIEFTDTFRFALGITLFPFFYALQSFIISFFFSTEIALTYFVSSLLLVLLYTKTTAINAG